MADSSQISPASSPIGLLDTSTALVYAHLHPVLVVSTLYFQLAKLVANPESALVTFLAPLALSQFLYCALCLPQTGSEDVKLRAARKKPGAAPKTQSTEGVGKRISVRT
jgi:GPI biosynthesis protein family Pig-F